jgi:hypothetical protein
LIPPVKAFSVTEDGEADGFENPLLYAREIGPDGTTRILVSCGPDRLQELHFALIKGLTPPLGVLYVQVVDRVTGRDQNAEPKRWLSLEQSTEKVLEAFEAAHLLLYRDARSQVWVRGALGEQLVLDELGLMYVYPDDPSFGDILEERQVPQAAQPTIADRDYVRVAFCSEADSQEQGLLQALNLSPYGG